MEFMTILDALNRIPISEIRDRAMTNVRKQYKGTDQTAILEQKVKTISEALGKAFDWVHTPEDLCYWQVVAMTIDLTVSGDLHKRYAHQIDRIDQAYRASKENPDPAAAYVQLENVLKQVFLFHQSSKYRAL